MLQQTQVAAVLVYYPRFLNRFPDVASLAAAPQDEVLALWSGLGYYSRARNLHRCAQAVVAVHGGVFPSSSAQLAQLPGIGRSTAAAIAAFCHGERVAILDGNVKRVLTRSLGFGGDLSSAAQERQLWALAEDLAPPSGVEAYTQGMMDLGATVCLARAPRCTVCPVRADCVAASAGTQQDYPVKTRKLKRGQREHLWLWLQRGDWLWLERRPDSGVWAGLWSLPEFESEQAFESVRGDWPGAGEFLPSFTHVLTHLDWTLHPVRWTLPVRMSAARLQAVTERLPAGRWFALEDALSAGLPAPLRKLLFSSV